MRADHRVVRGVPSADLWHWLLQQRGAGGDGDPGAEGGAEGVYTAAIPELGLGVCLKADDGAGRAAEAAMLWTLQQLGVVDEAMTAKITATASPEVRNWAGTFVGTIRSASDLAF